MKPSENCPKGLMRTGQVVLVLALLLVYFAIAEPNFSLD